MSTPARKTPKGGRKRRGNGLEAPHSIGRFNKKPSESFVRTMDWDFKELRKIAENSKSKTIPPELLHTFSVHPNSVNHQILQGRLLNCPISVLHNILHVVAGFEGQFPSADFGDVFSRQVDQKCLNARKKMSQEKDTPSH
ncbi:uncharacterized protein CELE_Y38H8A.7 [Caenorhabditis elegans]|uniref:Uncharacterized protein n=1 Tax=Caenorhabditis elegans TaxID=6239 RepID=Q7K7Q1_CAEEL|nr:Uncharacterized protein CELE_Y38H8A.7 [Caenorhabditis elegans]CAE46681.3 Uncharacterized protein CELE_Y38H8A.7 [Caenorhabditis elegans]|eukprot:NP_001023458.3 Uncharacterized protein CELE_Y38H8A.7 [Caenorhabditis elegans]